MTILLFNGETEVFGLTDLDSAREFLQKPVADAVQDQIITNTIIRATRAIQRKTRIVVSEIAVSHDFPYDGQGWLDLSPYYLQQATALAAVNSGGTSTTLTSTDWALRFVDPRTGNPAAAEDDVYTHLRVPKLITPRNPLSSGVGSLPVSTATSRPDPIPGYGMRSVYEYVTEDDYEALQTVTITGDWGYPEVPHDLEQACLITVRVWLSNYVSAFSRVFNDQTGRVELPEDIPTAANDMLRPFLRTGLTDATA